MCSLRPSAEPPWNLGPAVNGTSWSERSFRNVGTLEQLSGTWRSVRRGLEPGSRWLLLSFTSRRLFHQNMFFFSQVVLRLKTVWLQPWTSCEPLYRHCKPGRTEIYTSYSTVPYSGIYLTPTYICAYSTLFLLYQTKLISKSYWTQRSCHLEATLRNNRCFPVLVSFFCVFFFFFCL